MTPAEHYAEAERLATEAVEMLDKLNEHLDGPSLTYNEAAHAITQAVETAVTRMIAIAHVHATLATVRFHVYTDYVRAQGEAEGQGGS